MSRTDSRLQDRMVFLVGAQRSGTNWLQGMLGIHPAVATLPAETHLFFGAFDQLDARVQHGVVSSGATGTFFMSEDGFLDAARDFLDRAFSEAADRLRPGAARIVERSPRHAEKAALIRRIYPDSYLIHLVRDGRDVARSIAAQRWGPSSVAEAARAWTVAVAAARTAGQDMRRYREVRYEDLLADPGSEIGSLVEWLGLPASPDFLRRVTAEAAVPTNTDPSQPTVGSGKWRNAWSEADLAAFESEAGPLLRALGYADLPLRQQSSRPIARRARPRRWRDKTGDRRPAASGGPAAVRLEPESRQHRVDVVCAALAAGDDALVGTLLGQDAVVVVVDASGEQRARGPDVPRLLTDLAGRYGRWGTPLRGDVHPAGSVFTVVLQHVVNERVTDSVVVVRFGGEQDEICELAVYRMPLPPPLTVR